MGHHSGQVKAVRASVCHNLPQASGGDRDGPLVLKEGGWSFRTRPGCAQYTCWPGEVARCRVWETDWGQVVPHLNAPLPGWRFTSQVWSIYQPALRTGGSSRARAVPTHTGFTCSGRMAHCEFQQLMPLPGVTGLGVLSGTGRGSKVTAGTMACPRTFIPLQCWASRQGSPV